MAGIAGRVLSSGMLLNIADARSHADFHAPTDEKPHTPVSTILASPIKDPSGKIIGALVFINKRRNA
ncbi:hypothetical protein T484DRAFT_1822961 [Baffinella frigidus]|nr:hypothetical protein T484DRAFT_1822961 [Cryptophyta sp. CCMP2293]